jgi:Protein kinase domain
MQPVRFQMLEVINNSPSGRVWKAFDQTRQSAVAIKDLRTSSGSDLELEPEGAEALRDAAAASALDHPGIQRVLETLNDPPWIVMEYIEGANLAESMAGAEPKSLEWRLQALGQIGEALDYAHSRNIFHGDVKPEHLLVSQSGEEGKSQVKISGFGIAKLAFAYSARSTSGGQRSLEAVHYMAPELIANSRSIGPGADQYSLAVIAYELLTGERPFRSETVTSFVDEVRQGTPTPPSSINHDLNPAVDEVMNRALSQDPGARFPTCVAFVDALTAAVHPKGSRFVWIAIAAAVFLALLGAVIYVTRPKPDDKGANVAVVITPPPGASPTIAPPPPVIDPPPALPETPPSKTVNPGPGDKGATSPQPPSGVAPVGPTRYGLRVSAGGTPISPGAQISEDDPRLLNLQYTVNYSNVRRKLPMKVVWSVDGDPWAEHTLSPAGPSGTVQESFHNVALPGSYRVWLAVGDHEEQVMTFTVTPSP